MSQALHDVVFVGAGPGAPELITVAGKSALEQADIIVYAGSLVSKDMLTWAGPDCQCLDSAGLNLDEIIAAMAEGYGQGKKVVRLHTGDPSLYGAVAEQFHRLKQLGIPYRVIPGVTAAFAAAAALGLEYTLPEKTQTLILTRAEGRTPVPSGEDLADLADHGCSMAIYLSAGLADKVSAALVAAFGKKSPVALLYRVSWPDQRTVWTTAAKLAQTMRDEGLTRQVLILAGPAVAGLKAGAEGETQSKLYSPTFSHGFRDHNM
jgi:precorrin-4/cobalt-precorrin-4 C11-methyltransferase